MSLSVVIITKNEERNVGECLKKVSFCDEIIVVDDESSDKTRIIAKSLSAKVFTRPSNKNISDQYNYGAKKAKCDWILFINADEEVTDELKNEILNTIKDAKYAAYNLSRKDYLFGQWIRHGETAHFKAIRLIKKGEGKWVRRVHEYVETGARVGNLINPLQHYPHRNLTEYINSINRWSEWHALANYEEGKRSNIAKILFYPTFKFIDNYVLKLGFLDGIPGFLIALIMSFHSFCAWSSLWLYQRK